MMWFSVGARYVMWYAVGARYVMWYAVCARYVLWYAVGEEAKVNDDEAGRTSRDRSKLD